MASKHGSFHEHNKSIKKIHQNFHPSKYDIKQAAFWCYLRLIWVN